jgi:MFS transporter, ACS family, allantoate permease
MVEALMDPKTWLFALFSVLDNIPNSLTNQIQIIIVSFGFNPLQTTLLSSVSGVIEIVTILTGVTIASQIPGSIAWVGILFFIPNLLGVFLVNFLPWHDKVGLLFALWLTGTFEVLRIRRFI